MDIKNLKTNPLFFILIFAAVFRFINLNQSLWLDEATSLIVARDLSWPQLFNEFLPNDFHPPLYYILLKLWTYVFGFSEIGSRSLSVLLGVATVGAVYKIGRDIFNKNVGVISALLLAVSPLHVYYSQEARMYVPAALFASVFLYYFHKILKEKRGWVEMIVAGVLLLATDYMPIFLILSCVLFVLIYDRQHLKKWFLVFSGLLVGLLPLGGTFLTQLASGLSVENSLPGWWQVLGKTNVKQLTLVPIKFLIGRISFFNKMIYAGIVGAIFLLSLYPLLRSIKYFSETKLLWFCLLGTVVLAAIFGVFIPVFSYFRFVFILPVFVLLVGYGIDKIKNNIHQKFVLVTFMILSTTFSLIYLLNPAYHREDWKSAISWIESRSGENSGTLFVTDGQRDPYYYYSSGHVPSFGPKEINGEYNQIWLMRYVQPIFDPEDVLPAKLESMNYRKTSEQDFNGVVVWEYRR